MTGYDTDIQYIKGVGEKRAGLLSKLDVHNLYDMIHFYPRSYIDFTDVKKISKLCAGETACVRAFVDSSVSKSMIRKNMTVYKLLAADETGILHITIFNSKFLAESLHEGEEYFFLGKVTVSYGSFEMSSPIIEPCREDLMLSPIYPQTAGLTSKMIGKIMKNALIAQNKLSYEDPIPDEIRQEYKLCHEQYALKNIHFPNNMKDVEIARHRLVFEELFVLQCGMMKLKKSEREKTPSVMKTDYTQHFVSSLPFVLTNAQQRAINQSVCDMKKGEAMNRLLQGDVGSGKTVVAAALIYSMVKNGFQCAMMAPTEVLAEQHFQTLGKMLPENINIVLLTGSLTASQKRKAKAEIESGNADVIVGTHAIITDDVRFSSLGFVVTDEQHRFGVRQRGSLCEKGNHPHVLVMSATPIPRTLSLIIYGDLDISVIDELPKGRQKIDTFAVDSSYKARIYNFIRKHLDKGLQAYIVCPLVEESESNLTAATQYAESLSKKEFASYKVGLLHGKMKPKEKKQIMEDFVGGKIQLLVSTTVIEVGIDVPNAAVMVIENADMFGLSQLHQLRGRVGRGKEKSYCILISDSKGESATKRLEIMCKTNDGFLIADEDLKLRGPGDFFGSKQHGLPQLRIADLLEDMVTLKQTRQAAKTVFDEDPALSMPKHRALKDAVERLFEKNGTVVFN
ncbi:MAG: ATP-dependent DNA helicase RecG [Acutalibacteraceae bacterium]